MTNLKRLSAAVVLTFVLAVAALADCEFVPGQIPTGPCPSSPVTTSDNSVVPGETPGPPTSDTVDVIGIAEVALSVLSLF